MFNVASSMKYDPCYSIVLREGSARWRCQCMCLHMFNSTTLPTFIRTHPFPPALMHTLSYSILRSTVSLSAHIPSNSNAAYYRNHTSHPARSHSSRPLLPHRSSGGVVARVPAERRDCRPVNTPYPYACASIAIHVIIYVTPLDTAACAAAFVSVVAMSFTLRLKVMTALACV
jgi:hypothetical protein